jgi:hypothetical protein
VPVRYGSMGGKRSRRFVITGQSKRPCDDYLMATAGTRSGRALVQAALASSNSQAACRSRVYRARPTPMRKPRPWRTAAVGGRRAPEASRRRPRSAPAMAGEPEDGADARNVQPLGSIHHHSANLTRGVRLFDLPCSGRSRGGKRDHAADPCGSGAQQAASSRHETVQFPIPPHSGPTAIHRDAARTPAFRRRNRRRRSPWQACSPSRRQRN